MEQQNNKSQIITQISHLTLLFTLVIVSLLNLTMNWGDKNLWITILTGVIGCIIPAPEFLFKKNGQTKSI
jgi:high-affinity K+ transport system ATPase subunit B